MTDDKDRRLLADFTVLSGQYLTGADKILELADRGQKDEALALVMGPQAQAGERLGSLLAEWSRYNEQLATSAGGDISSSLHSFQSRLVIAIDRGAGALGFARLADLPPDRHPHPRAPDLRRSPSPGATTRRRSPSRRRPTRPGRWPVRSTSSSRARRPWTNSAGSRPTPPSSRANCRARPRWPSSASACFRASCPCSVAGSRPSTSPEADAERLRRIAGYGLAEGAGADGSVRPRRRPGRPVRARAEPVALADLPPDYLRISSGLGGAAPVQAAAWPLVSQGRAPGGGGVRLVPRAQGERAGAAWRNCCRWSP